MRKIKHCFSFAGAALLVACATQAPVPTPTPTQPQPQTQTQARTSSAKFQVPIGYQKAMVKGQEVYCRTDVDTGSRISRTTTCYTMAQLQSQSADIQNSISNQISNSNQFGTAMGAGGPTGAGGGGAIGR
jgi:hypothetical protein